jgi:HK97 family phage portal protein
MRLFGFDLTLKRANALQPVYGGGERGWQTWSIGGEPFMGGFQQDAHLPRDAVLANWTVFACMTLIAGDVAKMRVKLMQRDGGGLWSETENPAFSPVLRRPNSYQTRQKFLESWIFSKLAHGNAYILKERDARQVVVALYVLDPQCVKPLVATNGDVYYELKADYLSHIGEESVVVPASEIIHDRMWCLHHPLVGLSPLFAAGLAASQGIRIQTNSARFFANMSRPAGILTSEQQLSPTLAAEYKLNWEQNYGPGREGRTAVLGAGLKYQTLTQSAKDSELVDQLKMSAEMVCSTFHVPAWKVGVGPIPPFQTADTQNQIYYDTCLQPLVEAAEACLDEGLGLGESPNKALGTELDLDALLRMDQGALTAVLEKQVGAGITSPNEARARLNMQPVPGGESPLLQQQNYSLPALAKRDAGDDPFGKAAPAAPAPTPPDAAAGKALAAEVRKLLELA